MEYVKLLLVLNRLWTLRHRIARISEKTLFCLVYRGKCDKTGHLVFPLYTALTVVYFYTKPSKDHQEHICSQMNWVVALQVRRTHKKSPSETPQEGVGKGFAAFVHGL